MRKLFIAAALSLSLVAGGCSFNPLQVVSTITQPIQNPVTPAMLNEAQKALTAAVRGLNVYKSLCVRKVIDRSCRGVVEKIQTYTRQLPPLLVSVRKFVRDNDQVNAIQVFKAVQELLDNIKRETIASGVS